MIRPALILALALLTRREVVEVYTFHATDPRQEAAA